MGILHKLAASVALIGVAATAVAAAAGTPTTPDGRPCACGDAPTVAGSYASASLVLRATPVVSFKHEGVHYYTLDDVTHFKGCAALSAQPTVALTPTADGCAAALTLNVSSLLFLRDGARVSACDAHAAWADVSPADAALLASKRVCWAGCGRGERPRRCAEDPCARAVPPCADAVRCVADKCGGCWARWLDRTGARAECPSGPLMGLEMGEDERVDDVHVVGA
ncbi:hypothetical protein BU14_0504s0010 [Porphyra umbilicalis]|uniref:Uncharacterized protein n=1 Tax=Porphyra umbilicalis TaxID=2786 RepID=A0A1X6NT57_PORUM|nr:hypothetical protein BU14_0504s0010 [Porphyra umbilicalis]|eukprot:OSX71757.1 hypothetical protein BU14_0504s0010 [Porphyra umbilicalis]